MYEEGALDTVGKVGFILFDGEIKVDVAVTVVSKVELLL